MSASNNRRRSARQAFSQCPLKYKREYLDGIDAGSNVTRRGSCFHAARANYISRLWSARQTDNPDIAQEALSAAIVALPLPFAEERDVRDLFARWIERFSLNLSTFFAVETELECFGSIMRFDFVEATADVLTIDDAKTSWAIPSQEALENDYQCAFYLTAARRLFPGFNRYEFRWDFVRFAQFRTVSKTDAEMDEIELIVADQDAAMAEAEATDTFPATGGSHCAQCLVKACPVVDHALRASVRLVDGVEAHRAASELAALNRAVETRLTALRAYCETHGAIVSGNVEWKHRQTVYNRYPAAAVLSVLEDTGTTFPLYFNGTAVKPLVTSKRKYVAVEPLIKALAEPTTKTEFRAKTVVEQDDREYLGTDE